MSRDWVTVHSVELQIDAYFIRSRFQMELDIEVQILDDLTIQTAPFASNIMGGIRIQVRKKDEELARAFLLENEYIKEKEQKPNKALTQLAKFTGKIPFLNGLRVEARLLIFVAFLLALIVVPFVIYQ